MIAILMGIGTIKGQWWGRGGDGVKVGERERVVTVVTVYNKGKMSYTYCEEKNKDEKFKRGSYIILYEHKKLL